MNEYDKHFVSIKQYLQSNFKKPKLSILAKIFGEEPEYKHKITKIEEYENQDYFRNLCLAWVHVYEDYLDKAERISIGTYGLFALSDDLCLRLCESKPENLKQFLSRQDDLRKIPPIVIAQLFCDSVIPGWHKAIESANNISKITGNEYIVEEDITVSQATFEEKDGSYILRFYTIEQWRLSQNKINIFRIKLDKACNFSISSEKVYERIFSEMPLLRY